MSYIHLLDSTLREGKQSALNELLIGKELNYVKLLDKIGIEFLEINHPYTSENFLETYRQIKKLNANIKIFAHTKLVREDLNLLSKEKVEYISSFVTGDKPQKMINDALVALDWSLNNKIKMRLSIENTFLLKPATVVKVFKEIHKHKALHNIALSDTNGSVTPDVFKSFFMQLDKSIDKKIPIEVHFHNDYGLAGANLYQCYLLATKLKRHVIVSISLAGMGERNGILSYGDVFATMSLFEKDSLLKKYKTKYYKDLFKLIFTDNKNFNRDPLNPDAFLNIATSHIKGVVEKDMYQAIKSKDYGFPTKFLIGELLGTDALMAIARNFWNIEIPRQKATKISKLVRGNFAKNRHNLNINELKSIISSFK